MADPGVDQVVRTPALLIRVPFFKCMFKTYVNFGGGYEPPKIPILAIGSVILLLAIRVSVTRR